jgi:molybdenum cofactor cytidylyltransferase
MGSEPRHAIVLAAGAGVRFGGGKLLAPFGGRPLVQAAVAVALAAPVEQVIVVLGCGAGAIAAALAPLQGPRLALVTAGDWEEGLAASLRAGVRSLPPSSAGCLVLLGDMPLIPPHLPEQVLAALAAGAPAVQPLHHGRPAHPAGFSSALYPDLLALTGDAGAGALLRGRADVVQLEAGDPGAVFDVDHRDDLDRATLPRW